jgi:hypothetical protein|tara:strand:- start:459 stop:641 length:183 start_codon:yes stop_codon:yes gene_type:complete
MRARRGAQSEVVSVEAGADAEMIAISELATKFTQVGANGSFEYLASPSEGLVHESDNEVV